MDEISQLIRNRNRILTAMVSIIIVWQGALLVRDITALVGGPASLVEGAAFVEDFGVFAWLIGCLFFVAYMRRVRRAEAEEVLTDELFRHHQATALQFGFKGVIFALIGLLVTEAFVDVPTVIAIRTALLVAVAVPLITFIVLSKGGEGE